MFSDQSPNFDAYEKNRNYGFSSEPLVPETINIVLLTQFTHPTKKWLLSIHFED